MKLVAGLGNPGERHRKNRHNVGFMFLDKLASKLRSDKWDTNQKFNSELNMINQSLIIAKPQTFMNSSGEAVSKLVNYYKMKFDDVYVVHDDLDIKLGEFKIQKGKGPKVHNGVESVEKRLGSKNFWRVRIGVENREGKGKKIEGKDYVLQNFTDEENKVVGVTINEAVEKFIELLNI